MDVEVVPSPSYMDDLYDGSEEKVTTLTYILLAESPWDFLLGCLGCFNSEEFRYWKSESEGQHHRAGTVGPTDSPAG